MYVCSPAVFPYLESLIRIGSTTLQLVTMYLPCWHEPVYRETRSDLTFVMMKIFHIFKIYFKTPIKTLGVRHNQGLRKLNIEFTNS